MTEERDKKHINWLWVLIIIIIIIVVLGAISSKEKERKTLEEISRSFSRRIDMIHASLRDKQKQFNRAYMAFKTLVVIVNFGICILIFYFQDDSNFFAFVGNCVNVYAAIGLLILFGCFVFESDPKNFFHIRDILKNNLNKYFFRDTESEVSTLPLLEKQRDEADLKLKEMDNPKSRYDGESPW